MPLLSEILPPQSTLLFTCKLSILHCRDADCAVSIPRDIYDSASHIQDSVNSGDQRDAFQWKSCALEYHGQHDDSGAGDTRSTYRGKCCGEDDHDLLSQSQLDPKYICDKDGADTLVDGGPVHVDGGAQRKDEAGMPAKIHGDHTGSAHGDSGGAARQPGHAW